jgi:hypothetical protein
MSVLLRFSSVPGMACPGMAHPAMDGTMGAFLEYQYLGHYEVVYVDYIDLATQQTLVAVPGGWYGMEDAQTRPGLTVPPPDQSWTPAYRWSPR